MTQDDQLIDIGGGTAQISSLIKSDLKMWKPVVCIDPSKEMLDVAQKNGVITIHSTAENFLALRPEYPLKTVLFCNCIHHFSNLGFIFGKLSEYMPDNGRCIITRFGDHGFPFFKAAKESFIASRPLNLKQLSMLIESEGLKCKMVSATETLECKKSLWYECIRKRFMSSLDKFSDEELEEGIKELEEEFKDRDTLLFDVILEGILVTK